MTDIVIALILLTILGAAAFYVYKAKKSGQKCIGCPNSRTCGQTGGCHCGK